MAYTAYGFDYTGGLAAATIDRATIDGHQISFICRYLSGFSKDLTPAEAKALSAAGISVVVVFETTASRAKSGHAGGVADAKAALAEAKRCGMPDGRPIYFAVDWDAQSSEQAAINSYLDGAASVLGRDRVGIYGGYGPVKRALDGGHAKWAWQTYAWSGGRWDARAQLQQYSNNHTLSGHGIDYDRAITSDYGQWRVGVTPTPTPTPLEEDEMLTRDLKPGLGEKTGCPFDAKFTKVLFFADNGFKDGKNVVATQPVTVRYAILRVDGTWQTGTVKVGRADTDKASTVQKVAFTDAKNTVAISVTRVDGDGTEPVTFTVA